MSKDSEFDPKSWGRVDTGWYSLGAAFPAPTFVMAIPDEVGEICQMKVHVNRWGEECLFAEAVDGAVYLIDLKTKTMTRAIAPAGLFS